MPWSSDGRLRGGNRDSTGVSYGVMDGRISRLEAGVAMPFFCCGVAGAGMSEDRSAYSCRPMRSNGIGVVAYC